MTSWTSRLDPRLNVFWQGRWRAGQVEPARYLYDHELVIVSRGSCVVAFSNRAVELSAGDYLIIPPDTFHTTTAGEHGVTRHCFHFDWMSSSNPASRAFCCFYPTRPARALITVTPDFVPTDVFQGSHPENTVVRSLVKTVAHSWETADPLEREICRAVFLELLIRLVWRPGESCRRVDRAAQLAQAARDVLGRPESGAQSVQALLSSLGCTYAHVCRLFHRAYGVTPTEYRTAVRLERAKVFLRDRRMTVAEAAHAAGFDDPGYFARCFRRQTGTAPSDYRRRM